jgi:hypothetical protein
MASTFYTYGLLASKLLAGDIDFENDTIKIMMTTSSYSPNQDTHEFKDDVTNEVSGTAYSSGGATLSNKSVGYTGGTNVTKVDADDVTWSSSTIANARIAVIYKDTGNAATSPLIGYTDFGADKSTDNGDFTITFDADGIFTLTTA